MKGARPDRPIDKPKTFVAVGVSVLGQRTIDDATVELVAVQLVGPDSLWFRFELDDSSPLLHDAIEDAIRFERSEGKEADRAYVLSGLLVGRDVNPDLDDEHNAPTFVIDRAKLEAVAGALR